MNQMIDFTNCEDGFRDYGGSDAKKSIEFEGKKYMLKFPEHQAKKNELQTSSANNVISEYIGSHIFQSAGIDAHNTLLGTYKGQSPRP